MLVAAVVAVAASLGAQRTPGWLPVLLCVVGGLGVSASFAVDRVSVVLGGAGALPGGSGSPVGRIVLAVGGTCLVAALVGMRARQDLDGLVVPLPQRLAGTAELGSDPVTGPFGTSAEVVLDGRRWYAMADRTSEAVLLAARAGERLVVQGRVSEIDGAPPGWVRARHLAGRLSLSSVTPLDPGRPRFAAANWVHELLERGAASMEGQHRALYLGLVVGDDRRQDDLTEFRFRASGLTHLLAVSGQNLAFVLVALSPLLRRLPIRARWMLGVVAISWFVLITRAEPSVLRAGVMAVLALTAAATGRPTPALRVVALTVCLLLVGDPMLVHSVGFRLSVAATSSLVMFSSPLARRLPGPDVLTRPLAVTLAAQLGAVPVMAATFGPASVLTIVANLLAEPAAGLVMTLGMTTGLLSGLVREEVAWVLQSPVRLAVWWIDVVADRVSALGAPPVGLLGWGALAAGAISCVWTFRRSRGAAPGSAIVLLVAPMLVLLRPPSAVGQQIRIDPGAVLRSDCGSWVVELEPGDPHRTLTAARTAEILEQLWIRGVTRVTSVSGAGAASLAPLLHAAVATGPEPAARGSPCGR